MHVVMDHSEHPTADVVVRVRTTTIKINEEIHKTKHEPLKSRFLKCDFAFRA